MKVQNVVATAAMVVLLAAIPIQAQEPERERSWTRTAVGAVMLGGFGYVAAEYWSRKCVKDGFDADAVNVLNQWATGTTEKYDSCNVAAMKAALPTFGAGIGLGLMTWWSDVPVVRNVRIEPQKSGAKLAYRIEW